MHPRYRLDAGQHTIDVRIATLERLFDNRDPAPFRERDLDPDLVEYLVAAGEDVASHGPFRVVFWLADPRGLDEIVPAYRAHFEYEIERLVRRRRRQRRTGQVALAIGATLLVALLSTAQLTRGLSPSSFTDALREGLLILSWVVMWRPVEALLYDWLPVRRERTIMARLLAAPVEVKEGKGPHAAIANVAPK